MRALVKGRRCKAKKLKGWKAFALGRGSYACSLLCIVTHNDCAQKPAAQHLGEEAADSLYISEITALANMLASTTRPRDRATSNLEPPQPGDMDSQSDGTDSPESGYVRLINITSTHARVIEAMLTDSGAIRLAVHLSEPHAPVEPADKQARSSLRQAMGWALFTEPAGEKKYLSDESDVMEVDNDESIDDEDEGEKAAGADAAEIARPCPNDSETATDLVHAVENQRATDAMEATKAQSSILNLPSLSNAQAEKRPRSTSDEADDVDDDHDQARPRKKPALNLAVPVETVAATQNNLGSPETDSTNNKSPSESVGSKHSKSTLPSSVNDPNDRKSPAEIQGPNRDQSAPKSEGDGSF